MCLGYIELVSLALSVVPGRLCLEYIELVFLALSVVPGRLALPTSTLSVWRSNQLSYRTGLADKLRFNYALYLNVINKPQYKKR